MAGRIHIVCSDKARNGKTLFARLYVDILMLRSERPPLIFDTDWPDGGLAAYYPLDVRLVDLTRTPDQVALFDTVLATDARDSVIDVSARHLDLFFNIFRDTDFDRAARDAGHPVAVFFMLDRFRRSLDAAMRIRSMMSHSQFILVRNRGIGTDRDSLYSEAEVDRIHEDRELVLPALSPEDLDMIENPRFSWRDFILQGHKYVPPLQRHQLMTFLETVYDQRRQAPVQGQFLL